MHIGVIGAGRIGVYHGETLRALEAVERLTIADVDDERAARAAKQLDVESASVADIFDVADAVLIASATSSHAELILRCLEVGKPVFCEKPVALDLETTDRIVDAVERGGGRVQMGFQRRFDPEYRAARDRVIDGSLGTLYTVRLIGHDPAPPHDDYIPTSGGLFRDFSVHDFDALRFVTGQEVVSVYADGAVNGFDVFARYDDIDTGVAVLRLESGAFASLTCGRHNPFGYDIRMELNGSRDAVAVGLDDRTPIRSLSRGPLTTEGHRYAAFQTRFIDAFQTELATFVRFARGEIDSPCTVADAREALRVAVACDRSRAERRRVEMKELA